MEKKRTTVRPKIKTTTGRKRIQPRAVPGHLAKQRVTNPESIQPAVQITNPRPPGGFERNGPAVPSGYQRVRFSYAEPSAREIFLVGSFNDWDPRATPLARQTPGEWSVELVLPPGEYRYRLLVDGEWRSDPTAQKVARNPFGDMDAILMVEGLPAGYVSRGE